MENRIVPVAEAAPGRASAPKERPILFSAPMVRAILEGRKTQTRRIVKPQPVGGDCIVSKGMEPEWLVGQLRDSENAWRDLRCPYGKPGDRLWVRETWFNDAAFGAPIPVYRADGSFDEQFERHRLGQVGPFKWRPSIHMPRWASRLTLDVTGIRVERLQDITANDILAEGVVDPEMTIIAGVGVHHPDRLRTEWIKLWDSINADRAPWDSNPWVWVVEFRKASLRDAPEALAEGSP